MNNHNEPTTVNEEPNLMVAIELLFENLMLDGNKISSDGLDFVVLETYSFCKDRLQQQADQLEQNNQMLDSYSEAVYEIAEELKLTELLKMESCDEFHPRLSEIVGKRLQQQADEITELEHKNKDYGKVVTQNNSMLKQLHELEAENERLKNEYEHTREMMRTEASHYLGKVNDLKAKLDRVKSDINQAMQPLDKDGLAHYILSKALTEIGDSDE